MNALCFFSFYNFDFFRIPFRAQNRAKGAQSQASSRQRVTNQVIRKGWLVLGGGGFMKGSKEYWFTLSGILYVLLLAKSFVEVATLSHSINNKYRQLLCEFFRLISPPAEYSAQSGRLVYFVMSGL